MELHLPRRAALAAAFVVVGLGSSLWLGAQQQGAASADNPANFTGRSFRMDASALSVARRGFDAGARANWHVHDANQLLFVEKGRMRYQVEGQPMRELGQHETAYLPGGVAHWHGASPGEAATQVSVQFGPGIKWMESVTDEQYAGKGKR